MKYKEWLLEQFLIAYEAYDNGVKQQDFKLIATKTNTLYRLGRELLPLGIGDIKEDTVTFRIDDVEWTAELSDFFPYYEKKNDELVLANDKVEGLQADLEYAKAEVERLKAENNTLVPMDTSDSSLVRSLMEKNKELQRLAYTDTKYEVYNNNAFNRDFKTVNETRLVLVGIVGMRDINASFGKNAGDKVIKTVSQFLAANYPDKVYRILGDQFAIIEDQRSFEEVSKMFLQIRNELSKLDISIVYGVADSSECTTKKDIIAKAEERMKDLKFGKEAPEFIVNRPEPQLFVEETVKEPQKRGLEKIEIELTDEELMANMLNQ